MARRAHLQVAARHPRVQVGRVLVARRSLNGIDAGFAAGDKPPPYFLAPALIQSLSRLLSAVLMPELPAGILPPQPWLRPLVTFK